MGNFMGYGSLSADNVAPPSAVSIAANPVTPALVQKQGKIRSATGTSVKPPSPKKSLVKPITIAVVTLAVAWWALTKLPEIGATEIEI